MKLTFKQVFSRNHLSGSLTSNEHVLLTSGELPKNEPFLQLVQNGSLLDAWSDMYVWHVRGNIGFIGTLMDNPIYKTRFLDHGLRLSDAYGCALDYMFAPSAEMKNLFSHEFKIMSSNWLTMGIQIRLGNSSFDGESHSTDLLSGLRYMIKQAAVCLQMP